MENRFTLRRALENVGIGFLTLIVLLIGLVIVLSWRAESRLDSILAELRAAGQPTSRTDLTPPSINDDENAAVQLAAISGDLDAWEGQFLREFEETKLGENWGTYDGPRFLPSKAELAVIEPILDAYPKILPAVDRAAAAEHYSSVRSHPVPVAHFIDEALASIRLKRTLANYADAKMRVLAAHGNRNEAVRLGIKMLRISRHYDQDPMLINYLVSLAIRGILIASLNDVLQSGPIVPEVCDELDLELATQDQARTLVKALQTERAVCLEFAADNTPTIARLLYWPSKNYQADLLDYYSAAITAAKYPWYEVRDTLTGIQSKANSGTVFVKNLAPHLRSLFIAEDRNIVLIRCLRALNSINRFEQQHDQKPVNIQELGLPENGIIDPFSGKPLKLKEVGNGWLIYSVFVNEIDDHGDFTGMKDWGLAPPGYVTDDAIDEHFDRRTSQ